MIIYDPSSAADCTRGTVNEALVEAIDLAPTFVEAAGGEAQNNWLEGRSLLPLLYGATPTDWRDIVISEYNYSLTPFAAKNFAQYVQCLCDTVRRLVENDSAIFRA